MCNGEVKRQICCLYGSFRECHCRYFNEDRSWYIQGKFNLLSEANVILRSTLLTDLLIPSKTLSLISQRVSTDVITIVNAVQNTREKYVKWYEHFSENPEKVCELPTLKVSYRKG